MLAKASVTAIITASCSWVPLRVPEEANPRYLGDLLKGFYEGLNENAAKDGGVLGANRG